MVWSFLFLFGFFNYTEINSTREWNGFPYRLFTLPVRTWQLVVLPMLFGVVAAELVYVAWIKLVWTHGSIPNPEWFAAVLGAYMVFYQTALWSLAGFPNHTSSRPLRWRDEQHRSCVPAFILQNHPLALAFGKPY